MRRPSRGAVGVALAFLAGCAAAPGPPGVPPPERPAPVAPPGRAACYGPDPDAKLAPVEAQALEVARARLGRAGRRPVVSGGLVLAARELARGAAGGAADPLSRARVRTALAHALAWDAAPAAVLVEAPAAGAVGALSEALAHPPATHVGAGAFEHGGSVVLVLLASERRAQLAPFPREVAAGAEAVLSGTLGSGLTRPRVFLTLPSGAVSQPETRAPRGPRAFEARLVFPVRGAYSVEVVGDGEGGPELVALFTVAAGGAPVETRDGPARAAEPADDAEAEAAVVRAVNALRRRQGLGAVSAAAELAAVARRHSAAMAAQDRVAHVLPGSGDAAGRLRSAGIAYRAVYENVARAGTALGAHETLEASPAHRGNLLTPDATLIGVGITRVTRRSGDRAVYLTEVLVAPPDDGRDSRLTPDARVREALWRERERLHLPALGADAALDDLARDAAVRMQRRDVPDAEGLGEKALGLRRGVAAVDVFVASGPAEAIRSANLRDARFRRVGVGVTMGDSRRFGAGRLWIAVVYTD
jgi:uncharacterized protein YkwD